MCKYVLPGEMPSRKRVMHGASPLSKNVVHWGDARCITPVEPRRQCTDARCITPSVVTRFQQPQALVAISALSLSLT